jgi:hypothetical protein
MKELTNEQIEELVLCLGFDAEFIKALYADAMSAGVTKSQFMERVKTANPFAMTPDLLAQLPKPSPLKPFADATLADVLAVLVAALQRAAPAAEVDLEAEKSMGDCWAAEYDQYTSRGLNPGMPTAVHKSAAAAAAAGWAAEYDALTSRGLNPDMPAAVHKSRPPALLDYDQFTSKTLNR